MPDGDAKRLLQQAAAAKWAKFCPRCGNPLSDRFIDEERQYRRVCPNCGFIFYLNPKVAAGAIPQQDGKIWLVRRNIEPSSGCWTFPGGYVDLGECVPDAAVRETYEETMLRVRLDRLLNVYSYGQSGIVMIAYCATVIGGTAGITPECREIQAFGLDEIPWNDLAFPSTREALAEYVKLEASKK
ncbi:MAG: NUDIX hydrolase [Acidobacteria bacterium]|nr:NUDIX hydrolase [Acidobacteriota bacterium]